MTELSTIVTSLDWLLIPVLIQIVEALCLYCTPEPTPPQSRQFSYDSGEVGSFDKLSEQDKAMLLRLAAMYSPS